jgi:hypothetical protein
MRRAISVLLIAVVAAFTMAACGGSEDSSPPTKAEYKQEYTPINDAVGVLATDVGSAIENASGKSNKQLEKTFGDLADRMNSEAGKLDDLTPADDPVVQTQQPAMVKAMRTIADDLDAVSSGAKENDLKGAAEGAAKLTRDAPALGKARRTLNKALGIKTET